MFQAVHVLRTSVDLVVDGIDWSRSFARGSYIQSVFPFQTTTSKMLKRDTLHGIRPAGVLDRTQGLDGHYVNLVMSKTMPAPSNPSERYPVTLGVDSYLRQFSSQIREVAYSIIDPSTCDPQTGRISPHHSFRDEEDTPAILGTKQNLSKRQLLLLCLLLKPKRRRVCVMKWTLGGDEIQVPPAPGLTTWRGDDPKLPEFRPRLRRGGKTTRCSIGHRQGLHTRGGLPR